MKLQPTFTVDVPLGADELMEKIRLAIRSPELLGHAVSAGQCVELTIDAAERRFWSPHLSVSVNDGESSSRTELFCRFSPRPEVWTMFMFFYFIGLFGMCAAAIYGYVQWFLGSPPWALTVIPIGLVTVAVLHSTSLIGQGFSSDQMELLRARLERTLEIVLEPNLADRLRHRSAFPDQDGSPVVVHETHISWIFLAGEFAYKVKKPVKTDFLDYSTLENRERLCREELRLDRRFSAGLYLDVVPITRQDGHLRVDGRGETVEWAVKMRRFAEDALLSHRLDQDRVSEQDVADLAFQVATFHEQTERSDLRHRWGSAEIVLADAMDNLRSLEAACLPGISADLDRLNQWTRDFFDAHQTLFSQRLENGFIRECHGDMHLANVIQWRGVMTPFDGIEFNDRYRWIDVLSDAAFVSMDFAARGRPDLGRSFINAYLEKTGDHGSLPILRWYLVYRALVRAKVSAMRVGESKTPSDGEIDRRRGISDCTQHVELACRFTLPAARRLWITHGFSGSGKTRGSEAIVRQYGAIRFRSDIERKRHHGLDPLDRPDARQRTQLYGEEASRATYCQLERLARTAIGDGFCVVIDAAFLKHAQRSQFRQIADSLGANFAILDFQADEATLRRRIAQRTTGGTDASDANIAVLESQLAGSEPLRAEETPLVAELPVVSVRAVVSERAVDAKRAIAAERAETGRHIDVQ